MSEKFYRDSSNKVFGGLISGVVRHLGLSKFVLFCLRVLALIMFLSTPICFLLYIIIAVMVPSKEYLDDFISFPE